MRSVTLFIQVNEMAAEAHGRYLACALGEINSPQRRQQRMALS
jgi:hypothetical protein